MTEDEHSEDLEAAGPEEAGQANGAGAETETSDADELTPEKFEALNDLYMRALAEAQNVRRIADRERAEMVRYGAARLARDLLPVHDNLERALASVDDRQREAARALVEGIELTLRSLLDAAARHGVVPIEPSEGDQFDPDRHEAMFNAASADVPAGNIISVMTKGFMIHDRLLRPAHVGVSAGLPESAEVEKG